MRRVVRAAIAGGAVVVALACSGGPTQPSPTLTALPSGSPREMLDACAAEPFPELAWGCRIEAAAAAGRVGDADVVEVACRDIPNAVWKDECRFRAGEELGRHGFTSLSLDQCGLSEKFGRFCLTHAGWGMPPDTTRDAEQWVEHAEAVLPETLQAEAADILRARWWFNRYVGTGDADPLAAQSANAEEAAHARGAWAIEVLRITGGDEELARAVWQGRVGSPPGRPLPVEQRVGRYDVGMPVAKEVALPHIRTFGDARRLVGQSVEEDLAIAFLEARFFLGEKTGDVFRPYLDDPRPRVRYTAFHLFRILPSDDAERTLRRYQDDPDGIVRAHVKDAITFRTWGGRPNSVGPRKEGPAETEPPPETAP